MLQMSYDESGSSYYVYRYSGFLVPVIPSRPVEHVFPLVTGPPTPPQVKLQSFFLKQKIESLKICLGTPMIFLDG